MYPSSENGTLAYVLTKPNPTVHNLLLRLVPSRCETRRRLLPCQALTSPREQKEACKSTKPTHSPLDHQSRLARRRLCKALRRLLP